MKSLRIQDHAVLPAGAEASPGRQPVWNQARCRAWRTPTPSLPRKGGLTPNMVWAAAALLTGVVTWAGVAAGAQVTSVLTLHLRRLVETAPGTGQWKQTESVARWDPRATAVVICDMWDRHWCQGATARVAEMAPRMNRVIGELRRRGVLIIHCPSETMPFYKDTPQRKLAQSAPKVDLQEIMQRCLPRQPQTEPPLPIDDSDGGCNDLPRCQEGHWPPFPWSREIATLEIKDGDAITDSAEAYYLMRQRGITNVIVMGVHENMCVLGRPFTIRQMVQLGQNVVLVRDLTDTMYNSRRRPFVDHFTGTDLVCWHIEKYWCPTVTSDQIIGGRPFRFAADTQPPRVFHN